MQHWQIKKTFLCENIGQASWILLMSSLKPYIHIYQSYIQSIFISSSFRKEVHRTFYKCHGFDRFSCQNGKINQIWIRWSSNKEILPKYTHLWSRKWVHKYNLEYLWYLCYYLGVGSDIKVTMSDYHWPLGALQFLC